MKFSIVVAADKNLGIGKNNTLPWRLPADLKYFKELTMSGEKEKRNAVIMGRKTWDSLPERFKPLPGRLNIVLSRRDNFDLPPEVLKAGSLDEALDLCESHEVREAFVIGGAEIFADAVLHRGLKRVYLTEIHGDFHCDCFFPSCADRFRLLSESEIKVENDIPYCFKILEPAVVAQK